MSIRTKAFLIVMGCVLLPLVVGTVLSSFFYKKVVHAEFTSKALILAEEFTKNSVKEVILEDEPALKKSLKRLLQQKELVFGALFDTEGHPLVFRSEVNVKVGQQSCRKQSSRHVGTAAGDELLEVKTPIIRRDGQIIGSTRLLFSFKYVNSQILTISRIIFGVSLLVLIFVSALGAYISERFLTKPLMQMVELVKKIAQGEYSQRITMDAGRELGILADSVNTMSEEITKNINELKSHKEELRITLDNIPDSIITMNLQGKILNFNPASERYFEKDKPKEGTELLTEHIFGKAGRETYLAKVNEFTSSIGSNPKPLHFPMQYTSHEQDQIELEMSLISLVLPDENYILSVARDVTERNKAEREIRKYQERLEELVEERTAELKATQNKLMEISRQAGMAEVATDILHNVGNVLNSLNIDTGLLRGVVESSKVKTLGQCVELLQKHVDDLGTFFTSNPKGKIIPSFLEQLSKVLEEEQSEFVALLQKVTERVNYLKVIVAAQQDFAKVKGHKEECDLVKVLQDSLAVNLPELKDLNITVLEEYDNNLPKIKIYKQQVTQILVNLISNAKNAVIEPGAKKKEIKLSARFGEDVFEIRVEDQGCGITEENMSKIFSYGFTTRKEGHGFGLHHSGNLATELGGSLDVSSEGFGHGATFLLKLPPTQAPKP